VLAPLLGSHSHQFIEQAECAAQTLGRRAFPIRLDTLHAMRDGDAGIAGDLRQLGVHVVVVRALERRHRRHLFENPPPGRYPR
jgi:hypothetical protein